MRFEQLVFSSYEINHNPLINGKVAMQRVKSARLYGPIAQLVRAGDSSKTGDVVPEGINENGMNSGDP